MPRGVYDRSKMKAKRAAAAGAPTAAKKTTGRKPGRPKGAYAKKTASPGVSQTDQFWAHFNQVRLNLDTLVSVAEKFPDLPSVRKEVDAHVAVVSALREKTWPEETEEKAEPANGTTTQTQSATYPTSVPMPPQPVQVPPIPPAAH